LRIWEIPPKKLCRQHLLGEHQELHAIWSILTNGKKGFAHHPETLRWKNKLKALYLLHEVIVAEMLSRGYLHKSPLDPLLATGLSKQDILLESVEEQKMILKNRKCSCNI